MSDNHAQDRESATPRDSSGDAEPTVAYQGPVAAAADLPDPLPGEFRLVRLLGGGTFGKVWLADDLQIPGRQVALKTLRFPNRSTAAAALAALRQEAQFLSQVKHPHIVQVHVWRVAGEDHYLVLEYVAGGSLADRLEQGPFLWQKAARYVADVSEGLLEVHARGILHRDIKPANILWDPRRDEALLTDFGVSARLGDARAAGTLPYMAPEVFQGQATPASDVYSLAVTLFTLVTGDRPFPGLSMEELRQQIEQGLLDTDARFRNVPEPLERLIRSGLAAEPGRRPALPDFISTLRGSLNQLLADSIVPSNAPTQPPGRVNLHLIVSRLDERQTYQPVATTQPRTGVITRDLKKVPPAPAQVHLKTGDRVRIEVLADQTGYVTVFNVGPSGNLNLLYPEDTSGPADVQPVDARRPLHVLDVELTPPAGRERLFAIWSRQPWPAPLEELHGTAERGELSGSRAYRATRVMMRVQESMTGLRPEDWRAVVLELDHCPA